jgi:hypothetical protein
MKYYFLIFSSLFTISAFAQSPQKNVTRTTTQTATGAELNRMFAGRTVTDKSYYDINGNKVRAAEVKLMLRSFNYDVSVTKLDKFPDYKNVLVKVNKKWQAESDSIYSIQLQPNSDKLKRGVILDTKPLYKYVDKGRLEGKIIALIFWSDAYYSAAATDVNERLNSVLSDYKIPGKIEILSITHHPAERATQALFKNPIVNTQHILDAEDLTKEYKTENDLTVVLTDSAHKILYAVKGSAAMTPRQLDKYLKAMLKP